MKKQDFERYVTRLAGPTRYPISITPVDRL